MARPDYLNVVGFKVAKQVNGVGDSFGLSERSGI